MRLANIWWNQQERVARWDGEGQFTVLPTAVAGVAASSTDSLIAHWHPELAAAVRAVSGDVGSPSSVRFRPAVAKPGKILCVGLNYRQHVAEMGHQMPEVPQLFSKFANALAAHGDIIPIPPETQAVDYEGELAVVVGQGGRHIPEATATAHLFGYTTANDVSARDLQHRTSQWLLGKSLDRFAPVGPWVVTTDEAGPPDGFQLSLTVNGEPRQRTSTSDMIFSVPQIVAYASRYWALEPGDLILTGTPSGVINGMPEASRRWLAPGDLVVVELEGLSRLENRFEALASPS